MAVGRAPARRQEAEAAAGVARALVRGPGPGLEHQEPEPAAEAAPEGACPVVVDWRMPKSDTELGRGILP